MAGKSKLKPSLSAGGEQAEADPYSEDAFIETSLYEIIESRDDTKCFVIGRTGAGKSALLQHLEEMYSKHVIRINPEDLSLPYVMDLQVVKTLEGYGVKLDYFWIALWKHVLLVEIIRHRYEVNTAEAKLQFMTALKDKLRRDPGKQSALEYLDEFQGKFWNATDERVREITDTFRKKIEGAGGLTLGNSALEIGTSGSTSSEMSQEHKRESADRFQRIVNETQLAKLNQMISVLNEEILDEAHFTYVVIDDLDRDWIDEKVANDLIRCLFRSVLDLIKVKNLKVLVALRSNIFMELDFGSTGGQEEKFRALILEMKWTEGELIDVLNERVRLSAQKSGSEIKSFVEMLPPTNRTRGNPMEYILARTLLRPRDAIDFANQCLKATVGKQKISWEDIKLAESTYSSNRLLALRDEWKPTYPGIDWLFNKFKNSEARLDTQNFTSILDECILVLADSNFTGVRWLTEMSTEIFSSSGTKSQKWFENYEKLIELFYKIGLIGLGTNSGSPTFYLQNPSYAERESNLDQVTSIYIHRMFHKALDIQVNSQY